MTEGKPWVKRKDIGPIRWTHLYSRNVLDLISLYLFSVYIDVFFLLSAGVSRCSRHFINVPIHSLCVCKWGPLQHLHAQS